MTSLTSSVNYPVITVKNVYCDSIRISKCNINDNYIATFAFNADAGIHGLLLGEVKRQYKDTSYIISNLAMAITCDPTIVDKGTTVIDLDRVEVESPSAGRSRRHSRSILSMVRLETIASRRPTLMSRVDVSFRDVFVYKDSSVCKDTWFVSYSSIDVVVLSPMRVREHLQHY
jgi:hypothetical protein